MNTLPDKPSELIRVALADLEKCEADPRYRIMMDTWHKPTPSGRCEVCLAGSVMAQTLGADPDALIFAMHWPDEEIARKLDALDDFRLGRVPQALITLTGDVAVDWRERDPVEYSTNRSKFKSDMRTLADDLERAGL